MAASRRMRRLALVLLCAMAAGLLPDGWAPAPRWPSIATNHDAVTGEEAGDGYGYSSIL